MKRSIRSGAAALAIVTVLGLLIPAQTTWLDSALGIGLLAGLIVAIVVRFHGSNRRRSHNPF